MIHTCRPKQYCLLLNVSKTKAMVMSPGNSQDVCYAHFNAGNRQILHVEHLTFLGVLLYAAMSTNPFIEM